METFNNVMGDLAAIIIFILWPLSIMIAYACGFLDGNRAHRRITRVDKLPNDKTVYEIMNRSRLEKQPRKMSNRELLRRVTPDHTRVR